MFDLTPFFAFADDNHAMVSGPVLLTLIEDMQTKIEMMTKWLRSSGLTVNESKTEVCLFHKNDHDLINLAINGVQIRNKPPLTLV